MLGQDLVMHLSARHQVSSLTRREADIRDAAAVIRVVGEAEPEVVIHAAAWTAVDDCESDRERAFEVNAQGTRNIATACRRLGAPVLYLSTDYVFDGQKSDPYVETDRPNPLNVYGASKLEGEHWVRDSLERFWIVRISWLFGPGGRNFVKAILERARRGERLQVVNDQVGAPTYTADVAPKLEQILERASAGIYHVTNQGYCSWFEFAKEILRQAGLSEVSISAISATASNRRARRPRNSRLANRRLQETGLGLLPSWKDALRRYLQRMGTGQPSAADFGVRA